jgi:putative protease
MDSYLNQSSLIQLNRGSILKNDKSDFTELKNKMEMVYSRGFFSGWLHGVDHQQLVDGTYSAHRGLYLGKIEAIKNGKLILNTESLKKTLLLISNKRFH